MKANPGRVNRHCRTSILRRLSSVACARRRRAIRLLAACERWACRGVRRSRRPGPAEPGPACAWAGVRRPRPGPAEPGPQPEARLGAALAAAIMMAAAAPIMISLAGLPLD
jgi:hypothetical protein